VSLGFFNAQLEPLLRIKAKENQQAGGGSGGGSVRQKSAEPIQTRLELAKAAHVSHDTPQSLPDSIWGVLIASWTMGKEAVRLLLISDVAIRVRQPHRQETSTGRKGGNLNRKPLRQKLTKADRISVKIRTGEVVG